LDITHRTRNAKCRCCNLKKTIDIRVRMTPVELKKVAISTVRNSQIQSFKIRAEGNACQFTKEINILSLCIVLLGVKHMHKSAGSAIAKKHPSEIKQRE